MDVSLEPHGRTTLFGHEINERFADVLCCATVIAVVALTFWKILFTEQFSILLGWEAANQVYSWDTYSAVMWHRHVFSVWDPYSLSGHSFIGEMQNGVVLSVKAAVVFVAPQSFGTAFSAALSRVPCFDALTWSIVHFLPGTRDRHP
jgi:hypothetical protein